MSNIESDAAHALARANQQRADLRFADDIQSHHGQALAIDLAAAPADIRAAFPPELDSISIMTSRAPAEKLPTPMWQYIAGSETGAAIAKALAEGRITQAYHDELVARIIAVGKQSDDIIREALAAFPDNAVLSPVIRSAARHSTGELSSWPLHVPPAPELSPEELVEVERFGMVRS